MGYAYVPRNGEEPFGLNISAHNWMRKVLDQMELHANGTTERVDELWAVTNDGWFVPAEVAKDWGERILQVLDTGSLFEKKIPDVSYSGGFTTRPYVDITLRGIPLDNDYQPVEKGWEDLVRQFADFMIRSGGFEQW